MAIYDDGHYLRVDDHPDVRCVVFSWKRFAIPLEDIKKAHYAALEVVKAKRYETLIADTGSVAGVLFPDVVEWWEGEMIGKYVDAGIRQVLTVVPESALGRLSTKDWQKQIVGKLTTLNVRSLSEALAAAREASS